MMPARYVRAVEDLLLAWFAENGRDLPWRRTRDPYAILVSEVMSQQTQVERVVPRWRALARALADGRGARRGAGRRRDPRVAGARLQPARALRSTAPHSRSRRHGWPDDLTELPGVGRYTADAVACFAFGRAGSARRRQRAARLGAHRPRLHPGRRTGADGSRQDGLPRPRPALRRLPARSRVPVARPPLRAEPPPGAVRGLVPPAARGGSARGRRRLAAAGRRGRRRSRARRARAGGRRHRVAPG